MSENIFFFKFLGNLHFLWINKIHQRSQNLEKKSEHFPGSPNSKNSKKIKEINIL